MMLLLVTLLASAFIAADCETLTKDIEGESEVCQDKNQRCPSLIRHCNPENKQGAIMQMCPLTCGTCEASKQCPADHPYAYFKGTFCCKFNKESINPQFGAICDGSELSAASICCKDNKFVKCPHGKCVSSTAQKQCPADHPFPYLKGTFCCKFNKEASNPQFGASCDGSELSSSSMCCKDNNYVACPHGRCVASTAPKQCPADHPFPYLKGTFCCKFNKEGNNPQFGANCDGSELSSASMCCKDNKYVACPHGKCAANTAPKQCPGDHPFAYFKGTYCCKFNKEGSNPQLGASCDGSDLSSASMCCEDNKFVACPHGKCVSSTEPKTTCETTKSHADTITVGKPWPGQRYVALTCQSKVVGFRTRGDSGWLYGIQLKCADGKETKEASTNHGTWGKWHICGPNSYIQGVNLRGTASGAGGATMCFNTKMRCSDGKEMFGNAGEGFKKYNKNLWWVTPDYKQCPPGRSLCGMNVQLASNVITTIDSKCCKC